MSRMAARLARNPAFWAWLPVVVLPPVLVLNAALSEGGPAITPLRVLATVVACVPLVIRRRVGIAVMAPVVTGSVVLTLWAIEPGDTVVLIPAVALAEIGARTSRRYTVGAALLTVPCVMVSVAPFADSADEWFSIVLRNVAYCLLALAAGDAVRSRREAVERTAAAGEERALRRLGDERLRIAREVHDTVAHAIAAINVQSGVAAHLIDRDPEQARTALRRIKAASGDALTDLRATLGVLRDGGEPAPVEPHRGLDELDDLVAGLRAAGVRVELDVAPLPELPTDVQAAGYRIVQEALTNVLRHAGASRVRVRVAAGADAVEAEVVDDGSGTGAGGGSGNGIRGMRERAVALGGTLDAGPAAGGGWRVAARLPTRAGSAA
jgi:signal transduction histidine kinase